MHINELIEVTKKQRAAKQSVLNYCEENIALGMSEQQVADVLRRVGIIGDSNVSRPDIEQSFLSDISSNVFGHSQPLEDFNYLMRAIQEHLDMLLDFNVA